MHVVFIEGIPLKNGTSAKVCRECKGEASFTLYINYKPTFLCRKHMDQLVVDCTNMLRAVEEIEQA